MRHHRRSSQLARVAARVLASGSTAVDFVVEHQEDELTPWARFSGQRFSRLDYDDFDYLARSLDPLDYGRSREDMPELSRPRWTGREAEPDVDDVTRGEFLFARVGPIGTFVVTSASSVHRVRSPQVELIRDESLPFFKGRTLLNPGFLYEDARHMEVLLTVGKGDPLRSRADSLVMTTTVQELARAACDVANAPILFMQYPAAPFGVGPDGFPGHGGVRPAIGASIRMSIALDEDHPERRIAFLESVSALARRTGLELRVGDTRQDRVRGEWRLIVEANSDRYRAAVTGRCADTLTEPVTDVVPVTFLGPARPGSTMAIVQELERRRVGIVGVAISALQEVAFITFVLTLPEGRTAVHRSPDGYLLTEGLRHLVSVCDLGSTEQREAKAEILPRSHAVGYRALIGAGAHLPARLEPAAGHRYALWIIWNVPQNVGPYPLLLAVEEAAATARLPHRDAPGLDLRVEYARGRLLDNDMHRGRAKVSVTLPSGYLMDAVKDILGELAQQFEDGVRSMLARRYHTAEMGIRVEWRERWLGGWSPPR